VSVAVPMLPESAPFTPAQRAWLNGFFAGLMGARPPGVTGRTVADAAPAAPQAKEPEAEESLPWHDPALGMDERMKLAEGRPHARALMAAMAQLDCGACGYLCQTYAEAIARGEEKDLTRCAPGGKENDKRGRDRDERCTGNVSTVRSTVSGASRQTSSRPRRLAFTIRVRRSAATV